MADVELSAQMHDMYMVRYGEFLLVEIDGDQVTADVWGTQFLNDCPQDLWDGVDTVALAERKGATFCMKNGPRYWTLDSVGRVGDLPALVIEDFDGLTMRLIASVKIDPKAVGFGGYVESRVDRKAYFTWSAGRRVYELVDPNGTRYVMQALSQAVDTSMNEAKLQELGSLLQMPDGWQFETRVLEHELVSDTRFEDARVVQDEFQNTYTTYEI